MTTKRRENPFSSRHVRPGSLPYCFAPGDDAASLVRRLKEQGGRGQIVGPHGSGKSTLLAALAPELAAEFAAVRTIALRDGQRTLGANGKVLEELPPGGLAIVDGYEQLGRFARWRLQRLLRRKRCGLLVTSHNDAGLPTVFATRMDLSLAQALVARLLPNADDAIGPGDVERAFVRHGGNMREVLFDLYDLYEERRAGTP